MFEKLKVLAARLDELEMRLSAPDLYDDPDRGAKLLRRSSRRSANTSRHSARLRTRPKCCPTRT